jgi:hypothetical protein
VKPWPARRRRCRASTTRLSCASGTTRTRPSCRPAPPATPSAPWYAHRTAISASPPRPAARPSLLGRVGDTPIIGSGFYAGPHGAVAATGIGEHIVRHLLAHRVYTWIEDGMPLELALKRGVSLFDKDVDVGLIAVSRTEAGSWSNREMPAAQIIQD